MSDDSNSEPLRFGSGAVHRMLGIVRGPRTDEEAELALPLRPDLLQETGVVQGGILSALADASAVYLVLDGLPKDRTLTSIEFKMNFLRAATLAAGDLCARAEKIRIGRTLAVCRVTVSQGDRAVAEGLFTYLISAR